MTFLGRFRTAVLAAIFALLAAPVASADMKAFNAAVKAGDYKAADAEAKNVWSGWNKSDPDTAVVAREFGFASYVAGDYAAAREYGVFLKEKGATLPTPDDQPATSAVLLAAAEYKLGVNADTRSRLIDVLKRRLNADGLDNVSVLAAESLYRGDWSASQWTSAGVSADLASKLLARGGQQLALRALEARSIAAAAGFLGSQNKEDYNALADVHDAVIDAIDATTDPAKREALIFLKFQVQAWTLAVGGYFESSQQIGSNIPKTVKWRHLKESKTPLFEPQVSESGQPPLCKGRIDIGDLRYPDSAEFRGLTGAVIMRQDFDVSGTLTGSQVLGAVPARYFAEVVEKAAPSMRLKPAMDDPAGCRLDVKNRVLTIRFFIG